MENDFSIDASNSLLSQGKLGRVGWINVSKTVPEKTHLFLRYAYDKSRNVETTFHPLPSLGEEFYLIVRPLLNKLNLVFDSKDPFEPKKMTKKEKMVYDIKVDKITTDFKKLIESLQADKTNSLGRVGFNSGYVEFRLVALMHSLSKLEKSFDPELLIGASKVVSKLSSEISKTCIKDLYTWIQKIETKYDLNPKKLMTEYEKYTLSTRIDSLIPQFSFSLYKSQEKIFEILDTEPEVQIQYVSMNGSGKTSCIVPICGKALKQSKKVVYCCPNKNVRMAVANYCYSVGIPFAFVSVNSGKVFFDYNAFVVKKDTQTRKNNKKSTTLCYDDSSCVLYITDLFTCLYILKNKPCDILFFDEPTIGADNPGSIITKYFVKILQCCPKQSILASATLPEGIVYSTRKTIRVSSHETRIGCTFYPDGKLFLPHYDSQTSKDLENRLDVIDNNPFLGRFYTSQAMWKMDQVADKLNIDDCDDLEDYFKNPKHWNQIEVQIACYELLKNVTQSSDQIVKEFCKPEKETFPRVDLNKVLNSDSTRFLQGCLIACLDPVKLASELTSELLSEFNFSDAFSEYKTQNENILRRRRTLEDQLKDDDKVKEMMDSYQETLTKIRVPSKVQINTIANLPESLKHLGKQKIGFEDLPDSNVPDWILYLLVCGIGIYTESLDQAYLDAVDYLANRLSFIFTDISLAYGANYPITHIIIVDSETPSIVTESSLASLYQLAGRCGRFGWSDSGNIYTTGNQFYEKIKSQLNKTLDEGVHDERLNILQVMSN